MRLAPTYSNFSHSNNFVIEGCASPSLELMGFGSGRGPQTGLI